MSASYSCIDIRILCLKISTFQYYWLIYFSFDSIMRIDTRKLTQHEMIKMIDVVLKFDCDWSVVSAWVSVSSIKWRHSYLLGKPTGGWHQSIFRHSDKGEQWWDKSEAVASRCNRSRRLQIIIRERRLTK